MAENNGIYIVGAGQLYEIANAIREKTGEETSMCVDEMADAIRSIEVGGAKPVYAVYSDETGGSTIYVPQSERFMQRFLVIQAEWVDGEGMDSDGKKVINLYNPHGSFYDLEWDITTEGQSWVVQFTCGGYLQHITYKVYEIDFNLMDTDDNFFWEAFLRNM